jgi:hypothetical protein
MSMTRAPATLGLTIGLGLILVQPTTATPLPDSPRLVESDGPRPPALVEAWRPRGAPPIAATDRALAVALLLDSSRPLPVIDEGIRVADRLRTRYDIDTGHPYADRVTAARRAVAELDGIVFSREQLREAAMALGHDLDACGNYCRNVEHLAEIRLKQGALRDLAGG